MQQDSNIVALNPTSEEQLQSVFAGYMLQTLFQSVQTLYWFY